MRKYCCYINYMEKFVYIKGIMSLTDKKYGIRLTCRAARNADIWRAAPAYSIIYMFTRSGICCHLF